MKLKLHLNRAIALLLLMVGTSLAATAPTSNAPAVRAPEAAATPSPTSAPANPKPAEADYDPTKPAAVLPPPPAVVPERKVFGKATTTRSFIWEVKSPTNTVYLFGTIHVGKRAFYPLPEPVEAALDSAAKLVVEADIAVPLPEEKMAALIAYTPPDNLEKNIPKLLNERLQAQLLRLKIPAGAVKPMKPFLVGGLLSISEFSRLGYDMNLGVDSYLITRAREAGKPVLELESTEAQMKMMGGMPADLQEAFLDNAIATLESGRTADQVTGMVNAWQSGDTALMQEVVQDVNKSMRLMSRLDDVLLHSRHEAMLKKIEGYLGGKEIHFVAVGSLHLIGPRGLLQSLKTRGYEINQK
jgi:hypothetical protein